MSRKVVGGGKDIMTYRLGIDIGGTFTDFTLVDEASGKVTGLKVPTVPLTPERGVADGLAVLRDELGIDLADVRYFVHGMTIGLNTLLQRAGAKCALFTTEGFRDILNLQRMRLPVPYDFNSRLPEPLVPRRLVYGIPERVAADGSEVRPLDLDALDVAVEDAVAAGVEGIVVSFLHSYRFPAHERAAAERIAAAHPELAVCTSSGVWPEIREFERTSIALVNLYVRNNVRTYFSDLADVLGDAGLGARPFITQSNGGVMGLDAAGQAPVKTLFSGPAAGVIGAAREARAAGRDDLITFDMGGTSTDISIVSEGRPTFSGQAEIGGVPVAIPTIDIVTVGAGGGSIAWIDPSGLLKVGPESAGSSPGPACYGKGDRPALTDAFVVCGYVSPARFGGGRMALDPARSRAAIGELAGELGKPVEEAADDIVRVAVANMYAEITSSMEQRGFDPRDLTLVAYGGGGPVIANIVAEEIQACDVLVPRRPGTLCAAGALSAAFAYDAVAAVNVRLERASLPVLADALERLEAEARTWLAAQDATVSDGAGVRVEALADARYVGQSYELQVAVDPQALDVAGVAHAFNERHRLLYNHAEAAATIEVVNVRVRITAPVAPLPDAPVERVRDLQPDGGSTRRLLLGGAALEARVVNREALVPGDEVVGPAIVEQDDTTVVVIPGWTARVDARLNLFIGRNGEGGRR